MVIAQSAPRTERNLIVRQRDKGVERAARDPHRYPGKPRRVELEAAEAIEQTLLAPSLVVARRRMSLRHKEVRDREAVAAGSPEADHMPDVGHPGIRFREQHRPDDRASVGVEARSPVCFDDRDVTAEPSRVVAAAGKAKGRGDAVATLDDPRRAPKISQAAAGSR